MVLLEAGDIAWIELDPVMGTEQAGRRPALVVTSRSYHERGARAVICPVTSTVRPWAFSLPLPAALKTKGAVLIDQIRTIDRSRRIFALIERVPEDFMSEVRARLAALLEIE